jgi:PAS domain S-box-containing protein
MSYNSKINFPLSSSILILICGSLAAGIGFVALLGWLAGLPILFSLDSGRIPMPPSAALLFLLYGLGVVLLPHSSSSRPAFRIGLVIGAACELSSLLLFILSSMDIHPEAEHLGLRIVHTFKGALVGHISPVSAFCFVLAGLSFLLLLSSPTDRTKPASVAFWSSVLVVLSSLVLLLAYILGSPLLYGSSVIPSSLPASLGFLFLGTALLAYSSQWIWPHGTLSDMADTRSVYMLFMIFILLLAGTVTAGYLYLRNFGKEYRTGVEQQLSSIARLKVSSLEQYRKERLGDAAVLYKNNQFSDQARHFFTNPKDAPGRIQLQNWLNKVQGHYQYNQIQLLDAGGVTRLSEPAELPPVSAVIARRVSDVLRTREIAFQDFYVNEHDHRPYLSLIVPILDTIGDERAIGVVTLRIDPETYLYPFISLWPTFSRTAETLIIRREGSDVLFLNKLRFRKNKALTLRIPLERKEVIAVQAALGRNGIMEGVDYAGVSVLADVRAVPDTPWVLVARMSIEEIYAPLRQQLWLIIALIGALFIGAGLGVALLWRQQHVRFYRERYVASEGLRKSEERFRVLFNSMDEGFCIVDMLYDADGKAVDYRFVEINPAFEKQTGLQQALGKTIREMVPDHEAYWFEIYGKVALTGEAIRFDKPAHAMQRYYDVYAFRLGDEESRRVAMLFNDITERKQAEQELMEAKALIDAVVENVPLMIFLKEAVDLRFVIFNRAGQELMGHDRKYLLGKNDLDLFPPEQAAHFMAKDREVLDAEIGLLDIPEEPILTNKKGQRLLHTRKVCIRGADGSMKYLLGISEDITERKQAEETLKRYSAELEKSNKNLQEALSNVKTLSGMLPICASCKKIRDDKGYWSGVESYITVHSDVLFSHGICPECEKKMYDELEKLKQNN